MSFIKNLVIDLKQKLQDSSDVYTLHGFCRYLSKKFNQLGLSEYDYYPQLLNLLAKDLNFSSGTHYGVNELEESLHNLSDLNLIKEVLKIGDYYCSVSHTDIVYRIVNALQEKPEVIPDYPLIVVDEYQDFSLLETKLVEILLTKSPILIAGDDDQALYKFKHASADYLRELVRRPEFEKLKLPYCSRCTKAVVDAFGDVLNEAKKNNLLRERIGDDDKPFRYFPPDKEKDSASYPRIIWAECSVERNKVPYISKYVFSEISKIPDADFNWAKENNEPAVLVIGPTEFSKRVHNFLSDKGLRVRWGKSESLEESVLEDGYRRIVKDPSSRLGWRIICDCNPPPNLDSLIKCVLRSGQNLSQILPGEYVSSHLSKARHTIEVEEVTENEDEIMYAPIVCTTLRGSKGLSASHVFIVGMNNNHFPRNHANINDDDVCQMLVGLTRSRKQCQLVSCRNFAGNWLEHSVFIDWINPEIVEKRTVDVKYFS